MVSLAADALLRAYRALRTYDAARVATLRVRPWLLTILRNTARNAARDRSRRPDPPPSYETAEEATDGPGVEQQVESSHVQRELGAALAATLVEIGQRSRNLRDQGLEEGASTRMLIHAGRLTLAGLGVTAAAQAAMVLPLTDDLELREALGAAIAACVG